MKKTIIISVTILLSVISVGWLLHTDEVEQVPAGESQQIEQEAPEQAALQFMQHIIDGAQATSDDEIRERVYAALSATAQGNISRDAVVHEMSTIIGMQEVPNQGVAVSSVTTDGDRARVRLTLDYSSRITEHDALLVMEQGIWKIETVVHTSDAALDTSQLTPSLDEPDNDVVSDRNDCYIGGCSGQVCSDNPDVITTCEWREEYACYQEAICERQTDGACDWTETDELRSCVAEVPHMQ